jgi:hypothetical protein
MFDCPFDKGYGFQSFLLTASSSLSGRETDMSLILIPHGRPTYRLHMLQVISMQASRQEEGEDELIVYKYTPERGASHIHISLT